MSADGPGSARPEPRPGGPRADSRRPGQTGTTGGPGPASTGTRTTGPTAPAQTAKTETGQAAGAETGSRKYTLTEIRAAKQRTVMKTAVRPPPPPQLQPRSRTRPILFATIGAASLALALAGLAFHAAAALPARLGRLASAPVRPAAATVPPLDRDVLDLLGRFRPPTRTAWPELEATAGLRTTGNAAARKCAELNAAFLQRFPAVFPAETGSLGEVLRSGKPMLLAAHDSDLLEVMLVATIAMARHRLESGHVDGEDLLHRCLIAGLILSRGTAGQCHREAFEAGQTVATLARLQLVAQGYASTLTPFGFDRLGTRLGATVALQPDFRRLLIPERDRALDAVETARREAGFRWDLAAWVGFIDPAPSLKRLYSTAQDAMSERPLFARDILRRACEDAYREAPGSCVEAFLEAPRLYERHLRHRSVAVGAAAAATVVRELARVSTLPQNLSGLGVQLPLDPVSGLPFQYRTMGEKFRFYGVGPDGEDDGGDEQEDVLLVGPPRGQ